MKKENKYDFKSLDKQKQTVKIPTDVLNSSDSIALDLEKNSSEKGMVLGRNSRCVSVDTFSFAPEGRKEKKVFKGKGDLVKFRCSIYEKKLLKVKAKRSGLTLSEYIRRSLFEQEITERFTEEHIELYKMLIKYHNNFKSIGNMFKKRNPKLMQTVYDLADDIKAHLKRF
ncbi:mobilization protein MbpA [Cellulophaga sp. Hel_I_12]|uniref:mobilization protein MbpA n=1 Tax=Cellulophaga sp. Hel_I_12 TaxID=1249972 RepID=UPI000B004354|nr:mobilization protein MbpA [Cellulophaga sp. Hel_I_12]|tara:strand:+ start:667 stop:1176 length:510 start_codon:yes stop_codon:yes gene_type:complete